MDLLARSKLHAYCVVSHFLSARAELYYIFIPRDINISAI